MPDMLQIPRIALCRPHPDEHRLIQSCFPRDEYSIRVVDGPDQIISLIKEERAAFDAVILPPRGQAGDGGIIFVTQLRRYRELASTPVIAMCEKDEASVHRALLEAGAESILQAPFHPLSIRYQIQSLHRYRSSLEDETRQALARSGLRSTTAKALNCVREGILLFDTHSSVTFINTAAGRLLGISPDTETEEIDKVTNQFGPLLAEHSESAGRENRIGSNSLPISVAHCNMQRIGGGQVVGMVRILTLADERGREYGTAVTLTDLGEFSDLTAMIQQAQKSRSLSLIAAAGCLQLARSALGAKPISAADLFAMLSSQESPRASLNGTFTSLLETLDLIVPPAIQIKLALDREFTATLRPGDLFQVLGHLILEGVNFCGSGGRIDLNVSPIAGTSSIRLTLEAEANRSVSFTPSDYFSSLLKGSIESPTNGQEQVSYGVAAARQILKSYGDAPVSQEYPTERCLTLRVLLPIE